jgi:hypothetical protein
MRALAFGDLAASVWGAAWLPGAGERGFACLGAPEAVAIPSAQLAGDDDGDWRLLGDGTELLVSPAGEPVGVVTGSGGALAGFEQLCRVTGRSALDGLAREVDCLGRRGVRAGETDLEVLESVRDVSAWFEPADGLAVVALRPRAARAHDADVVTAAVLDPETGGPVADPRLSTTYDRAGRPIRAGFELWLGRAEEEFPRRAAGKAVGPHASHLDQGLDMHASLFRWHSRGREGAGVYILARRTS